MSQIVVTDTTPVVLHYQCTNQVEDEDGYMGNAAQFNSNVVDTPHQITARSGLSVTGVSTFSGGIQGNVIGNITGNVTGNITGNLTGTATTASSLTATADVDIADLTVGVATVSTRLYAEQIGVGTNSSSSDIHLLRSSSATLQVTSDTAEAIVAVGRSSTLDGNNGALIFGNTVGVYPYSLGGNTLDIVNYGTGNLNAYLDYGTAGVGTGNFNWIYGQDPTDTLMSLTYQGNLGLGVTNPTNKLHVVGTSTITDNAFFGQNINVSGNTNISGNLNLLGGGSLNANLTGNVSGNVNSTVGISTFNNISVTNDLSSFKSFIGIGTEASDPSYEFQVSDQFFVSSSGIGIGTNTRIANIGISALDADAVFKSVGIGTTVSQSALTVVGGAIISGVTTSLGGFTSELLSNPVKITVSGSILTFTVPGVGTTSLTLF
jgi:trimeric autotransporter adhesin